ncbi:hypothetical protein MKEN_00178000 [Mycena kentingensis (nom. inval.)]|nr:hypothetical protein MKEN_00178000 [Mycena kentingensis (nom. inval.)]
MAAPRETDPLLPRPRTPADEELLDEGRTTWALGRDASFQWLIPVLAVASLCRGISMAPHYDLYQATFCPKEFYPCGQFEPFFELPGITVYIGSFWNGYSAFMVSFVSVGWWCQRGDLLGRKPMLFYPILGTAVLDLFLHIVANVRSMSTDNARDLLSLGYIIQGLLGGLATYLAGLHAYAFDIAKSPLQRLTLFAFIDGLSFISFILGAVIGHFVKFPVAYIISFVLGLANLVLVFKYLPESLPPRTSEEIQRPTKPLVKTVFTPFSVFWTSRMALFGVAFYFYSLAWATDTAAIGYSLDRPHPPPLVLQWIGYVSPRVLNLVSLFFFIPLLAQHFRPSSTASPTEHEKTAIMLSSTLAQNALLFGTIACFGILLFAARSSTSHILYAFFAAFIPLCTVAIGPALYALAAGYFVRLKKEGQIAQLFGSMAVWGHLGMVYSYWGYSGGRYSEVFAWTATAFIISLVCLQSAPPRVRVDDAEVAATN